ncbi:MAG: MFS transporter [Tranquillimonas sp.]
MRAPRTAFAPRTSAAPDAALGRGEFVAMMAVLISSVAFSIDAMLPALPRIAADLTPQAVNRAQLVLTSFVLGLGIGTFVAGPLADRFGRKATIIAGMALYALAALAAAAAPTLEWLLALRLLQGIGAAGPRIASLALVRDLYQGRQMAQITSFIMTIFILVPALAPSVGAVIMAIAGWRGIFPAFALFGLTGAAWLALRQPETLPPERRRPLRLRPLRQAVHEVVGHRLVRLYIAVLALGFGQMFAVLSAIQQIYDVTFGIRESFPLWLMGSALLSGGGTLINARLVVRLGMRRLAIAAYATQTVLSAALLAAMWAGAIPAHLAFPAFYLWTISVFFMAGLTFGNLNALALQPMGHIAGTASSVIGAISTVGAVAIAAPIGLAFDGTPAPLIAGTFACSALAWILMRRARDADPAPKTTPPPAGV